MDQPNRSIILGPSHRQNKYEITVSLVFHLEGDNENEVIRKVESLELGDKIGNLTELDNIFVKAL